MRGSVTEKNIEVRPIAAAEWQHYQLLRLKALRESPDAFGSTFEAESMRPDADWEERLTTLDSRWALALFGLHHGDPAGLAWVIVQPQIPEVAHLYQMWVQPSARGTGLGRLLLEHAIAWARDRGTKRMKLSVTIAESPAWHLYGAAGFNCDGHPEPLRPGAEIHVQPMVKLL